MFDTYLTQAALYLCERTNCDYDFVHLLLESTTIARGCLLLSLNISRLFVPLVVISAMMPRTLSV